MNIIRIIFFWMICAYLCNNCYGQLTTIGKATVKAGVKSSIKQSVKSEIKDASKDIILKKIKDKSIKYGVKSNIVNQLKNDLTEESAKKLSKQLLKDGQNDFVNKIVKINGTKIANKEVRNIANGVVGKSSKEYILYRRNNVLTNKEKFLSNYSLHRRENNNKQANYSIIIEKAIGKTGLLQVEKFLPDISKRQKLIDDLAKSPQLTKLFQKNPTLIQNYAQCIDSKLRTDISHLRYLNYHADSYANACLFSKSKYLRASDLKYIDDKNGNTIVKNAITEEILGVISGNTISIKRDHSLLNMRLMKNMTYKVNNSEFETDRLGRPSVIRSYIEPNFKNITKFSRDKQAQRDFRKARSNASNLDSNKLIDDAGHIIAHDLGGLSDGINLVPQNRNLNRGAYKKMENLIKKDVKDGHSANITIFLYYKGPSERPSTFTYEYLMDGKSKISKVFENILETN